MIQSDRAGRREPKGGFGNEERNEEGSGTGKGGDRGNGRDVCPERHRCNTVLPTGTAGAYCGALSCGAQRRWWLQPSWLRDPTPAPGKVTVRQEEGYAPAARPGSRPTRRFRHSLPFPYLLFDPRGLLPSPLLCKPGSLEPPAHSCVGSAPPGEGVPRGFTCTAETCTKTGAVFAFFRASSTR